LDDLIEKKEKACWLEIRDIEQNFLTSLQGFLACNVSRIDHYSAQDVHTELMKMVKYLLKVEFIQHYTKVGTSKQAIKELLDLL
ncbi:6105_t:CDS:2, partial [Entrophospora sp. SA101]